jgi:hypothetical protein
MLKFKTFILEKTMLQDELVKRLVKLGYNKIEPDTRNRLFVYVPRSERKTELSNIADNLKSIGAILDVSDEGQKAGKSSEGTVKFDGAYVGQYVSVKPAAGAQDLTTDENESLAAYFIACKLKHPNTEFTMDDFKDLSVESKFSAEDLIKKAPQSWIISSKFVAKRITRIPQISSKSFTICQRSKSNFVKNISEAADSLLKKAGKEMQLDKWNPADIWMVNPRFLDTDFSQFESIYELNTWLQKQYVAKTVIGVSLKKTDSKVKGEIKNFRAIQKPIKLTKLDIGKRGFTQSKTCTITFNGRDSLDIRSFKRMSPAQGELKGRLAAGGKITPAWIEKFIQECVGGQFKVMTATEITQMYDRDKRKIYQYALDQAKKFDSTIKMNIDELMNEIETHKDYKTSPKSYLISKIQGMEMINALKGQPQNKVECAIQKIVSYAGSQTDVSSVYIKVS